MKLAQNCQQETGRCRITGQLHLIRAIRALHPNDTEALPLRRPLPTRLLRVPHPARRVIQRQAVKANSRPLRRRRHHRRIAPAQKQQQPAAPKRNKLRGSPDQRPVQTQPRRGRIRQLPARHVEGRQPRQRNHRIVARDAGVGGLGRLAPDVVPDVMALGPRAVGGSDDVRQRRGGAAPWVFLGPGAAAGAVDGELPDLCRWRGGRVGCCAAPDVEASSGGVAPDGLAVEDGGGFRSLDEGWGCGVP